MVNFIKSILVGPQIAFLIFINMFFWTIQITVVAILKLVFKHKILDDILERIYQLAVSFNSFILKRILKIYIIVQGDMRLDYSKNYIVMSNHISWSDIFIAQNLMNKIIPPFRFLSKKEVKYIPFVGFISWAYNFPLLGRNKFEKDKEKIIENIRILKKRPSSFFIYPEGTRYDKSKRDNQESPFKYLLKPKIGGLTTILKSDIQYENIIDITLLYPNQNITFWNFISGNISHVFVYVRKLEIKKDKPTHQIKAGSTKNGKKKITSFEVLEIKIFKFK